MLEFATEVAPAGVTEGEPRLGEAASRSGSDAAASSSSGVSGTPDPSGVPASSPASSQETSLQETSLQDTSVQETSLQETASQETSLQETSVQETASQETLALAASVQLTASKTVCPVGRVRRDEAVQAAFGFDAVVAIQDRPHRVDLADAAGAATRLRHRPGPPHQRALDLIRRQLGFRARI